MSTTRSTSKACARCSAAFLTADHLAAAIVIDPKAGEVFYLSREEKRRTIEIAVEEVAGRAPVLAGVIQPSTAGTIQDAKDALAAGVDGLFVMPPMGAIDVSTSWDAARYPEVFSDFLAAISAAVGPDVPMVVHPTSRPSAEYGVGLPLEATLPVYAAVPAIVGWKMTYSYDGYPRVARGIQDLDRHVSLMGAATVSGTSAGYGVLIGEKRRRFTSS